MRQRVLEYDFEESIGYWLTLATQGYHRAFNDEINPHGLTFRQSQVLFWLVLLGEVSQHELAARMQIEPPTLAGVIDRMEKAGWINRRACQEDRRKKLVSVSDKARPIWTKIVASAKRVRERAASNLTDQEEAELKRLLEKLLLNFQSEIDLPNGTTVEQA